MKTTLKKNVKLVVIVVLALLISVPNLAFADPETDSPGTPPNITSPQPTPGHGGLLLPGQTILVPLEIGGVTIFMPILIS
jgi:hypothetical protein